LKLWQILDRKNAEIEETKRQLRDKTEEQDKLISQLEKKGQLLSLHCVCDIFSQLHLPL